MADHKRRMMLILRSKSFAGVLFLSIGTTALAQPQTSANQVLDSCMQSRTAQGAVIGAVAGGILGNLLGGNNNRGRNTAIGAGVGGFAGGAIAWQQSYQACLQSLNLASAGSMQTDDYKDTAKRYNYNGNGVVLQIEGVSIPPAAIAGQPMSADLRYALLTPNAQETNVQVDRVFQCGNTAISNTSERFTAPPGTHIIPGNIPIASYPSSFGRQTCTVQIRMAAAGLMQEWHGNFVIIPNQQ